MSRDARVYCQQGPQFLPATAQGVLSGTHFVFKDLFDVAGFVTGAGNPTWLTTHEKATDTSPLISALLEAGAECSGRVQTDELAYSLNGQNVHYGTPVNPAAADCIPGGSSSGSAVAVANGDCEFSIGTDTGGSVRVPASYCGLYGLRPTLGSLDLSHAFELAKSFDTAGIFTRDLGLMRQVWSILSGRDKSGVECKTLYLDGQCKAIMSEPRLVRLQQWCEQNGFTLLEGDFLADLGWSLTELSLLFRTIQGFDIIREHDVWLSEHVNSIDPAIGERVAWARTITREQYHHAREEQTGLMQKLVCHLQQNQCLWAIPTTPSGPPSLTMPADELAVYRSQLMGLTSIAGLSGLPQLHLPMNELLEGPCGVSLMGQPDQEEDLLATGDKLSQGERE